MHRYGNLVSEPPRNTVSLFNSKLFIGRPYSILVLTMVLARPRRADAKNGVNNYQGPTTSRENAIRKYYGLWPKSVSVLEARVTSNAQLRISTCIFSNPSYF